MGQEVEHLATVTRKRLREHKGAARARAHEREAVVARRVVVIFAHVADPLAGTEVAAQPAPAEHAILLEQRQRVHVLRGSACHKKKARREEHMNHITYACVCKRQI